MNYSSIKKGAAGGLLALMLMTATPPQRAEAATLAELQAQIQVLLAQLTALQATTGNTTGGTDICIPFAVDLAVGKSGPEVTRLQSFLIRKGHVIPAGATGYFGGQTQSALIQFQKAEGVTPSVGYFGPLTRARVNTLCTVPSTPTTPTTPDNGNGNTPQPQPGLQGEASLENYEASNGDDTNLEEGQKNASVMDIEFDVEDGDARINRIDLAFRPGNTNNEMDPWDTFAEVSVYNGNDRIGRIDASDEDNWEEDAPANGEYRLRMSNISWVVEEDDTVELSVRVSVQKNVRGAEDGESWTIFVPTNGIRGLDADRANVFTGDSADSITIDIDEAGSDDELIVKRSDEDPDATTLQLEDDARSGWTKVFAFDLDTDNSTNDIEIRKIPVELTVSSGTVATFMRDVRLVIDGKTYTKKTITDGATNNILFDFKSGEFVIDGGDRVTVEVEVEFKQLSASNEGATIVGSVDTAGIVAEGADDLEGGQLSGSATGETHTMRTSGAVIGSGNTTAVYKANTDSTLSDDEGMYTIKFNVTAFNSDLYIPQSVDRGTVLGTAGVNFLVEDSSAGSIETASGTVVAVLDSEARIENGYFKVSEGQTKSFTLMVEYDPEAKSFYKVQLYSLNWNTSPAAPTTQQRVLPEGNYETSVLSISN